MGNNLINVNEQSEKKQTPIPKLIIKHADLVCFELEQIYLGSVQLRGIKIFQCLVQSTSMCLVSYLCICVFPPAGAYPGKSTAVRHKSKGAHTPHIFNIYPP